jgi:hypothetical protein
MDWTRQIDAYCERLGPDFWSEPVNAWTNGAFVAVGLAALVVLWRAGQRDPVAVALAALTVAIGVGSFLFHTFATGWAALADVLPIQAFMLLYVGAALHRFAGLGLWWSVLGVAVFLIASPLVSAAASRLIGDAMNRSEMYLPALLALLGVGGWLARRGHRAGRALLAAAGLFVVSVFFRSIDMAVCAAVPLGTHFLWHLLNAAVLGVLLAAFIREGPGAQQSRR